MKKVFITIMLILAVVFVTCSCQAKADSTEIMNDGRSIRSIDISKEETLIYDTNTRIVYIEQTTHNYYKVYTLYLSENGLPYRYVNGELVEVEGNG